MNAFGYRQISAMRCAALMMLLTLFTGEAVRAAHRVI